MGVLTVILLGCAALLSASSSAETSQKQAEAINRLENRLLQILEGVDDKTQKQGVDKGVNTEIDSSQKQAKVVDMLENRLRQLPDDLRADFRCGPDFPAPNGQPAVCDPWSEHPCCGPDNLCGDSAYHCGEGIDYRPTSWRDDLRCGLGYPAPNAEPAKCNPDSKNPCCSPHNWCGGTEDHCCEGCTDYSSNARPNEEDDDYDKGYDDDDDF
ncbi:uncharacterized protein LOC144875847 isoform X2 [Branchiostoma floridae x Branchiostoma japonicum]